jgi:hypothetical protein
VGRFPSVLPTRQIGKWGITGRGKIEKSNSAIPQFDLVRQVRQLITMASALQGPARMMAGMGEQLTRAGGVWPVRIVSPVRNRAEPRIFFAGERLKAIRPGSIRL